MKIGSVFRENTEEVNRVQATLYRKAGKRQEAYELLEQILFQTCSEISMCFQGLYLFAIE